MQTDLAVEDDVAIVWDESRSGDENMKKQERDLAHSPHPCEGEGKEAKRSFNGSFVKKSFDGIGDFYGVVAGYESPYYQVSHIIFLLPALLCDLSYRYYTKMGMKKT